MGDEAEESAGGRLAFPDFSSMAGPLKQMGSVAKSYGVGTLAQNILRGFFETKLKQLRPDQLQTLLNSQAFIADLIDESDLPESVETPINLMLRFMSREQAAQALDALVTPQLVSRVIEEAAPEVHSQIVSHPGAGMKFFHDQTERLKAKLRRIILYG